MPTSIMVAGSDTAAATLIGKETDFGLACELPTAPRDMTTSAKAVRTCLSKLDNWCVRFIISGAIYC